MNKYKQSFVSTINWLKELLPLLIAILLLISIIKTLWFFNYLSNHIENNFLWVFISDLLGSISAWNALNSYVIADSIGNFKENILVITVFLISWVTVWIIQLPAEIYFFWKKFALIRNSISFVFAFVWAYLVYFLINI
jgi:hypothetical protein